MNMSYREYLKNRLYSLLGEKENNGEWERFLDNIIIELMSLPDTYKKFSLIGKLSICRFLSYKYFRKTIFECMNLIEEVDVE